MVKVASWTLVTLLAACGVAHGADGRKQSGKLSQWRSVQALQPGALIEVLRGHQAGSDLCRVESSDDTALTCVAERPEGDTRLVFPRDGVQDVWVIEAARNLHIGRWIVLGVGVALVVAIGVELGVVGLRTSVRLLWGLKLRTLSVKCGGRLHNRIVCGEGWFIRCHNQQASGTDAVLGAEELLEIFGEHGG